MSIEQFVFYVLAIVAVAAAVMVISSRNPVHSVLFLILTFFNSAGIFVLLGAEFLGMVLIVVYVGAVAVLFMFVVMMLDVNFVRLREGFLQYLPIGGLIGVILLAELLLVIGSWALTSDVAPAYPVPPPTTQTNTEALGQLFYTRYFFMFQVAGVILLVAIIGAITLTLRHRPGVIRQDIGRQVNRDRRATVELRKVDSGSGIR